GARPDTGAPGDRARAGPPACDRAAAARRAAARAPATAARPCRPDAGDFAAPFGGSDNRTGGTGGAHEGGAAAFPRARPARGRRAHEPAGARTDPRALRRLRRLRRLGRPAPPPALARPAQAHRAPARPRRLPALELG